MSRATRNFIIAYILLVGVPVIGLVGVVEAGRNLIAPLSVDGAWRIQADFDQLASSHCLKSLGSIRDTDLMISQSGKNLIITLSDGSKATGSGIIEGTRLTASVQPSESRAGTGRGNDGLLALNATVDQKAAPGFFEGLLSVGGPSCTPVQFRAVRSDRAGSKQAH